VLEPDPRHDVPIDTPPRRESIEQSQPPPALAPGWLDTLGVEPGARIEDIDTKLRTGSPDPHLDGVGLLQARVTDAVGHDLAHEEDRIIDHEVIQPGPKRLKAPTCFGRGVRVRSETKLDFGEHTDAVPRTCRTANTSLSSNLRTAECRVSDPRWGAAETGRGAAAEQVAERVAVARADRAPVVGGARAPAPARAARSASVRWSRSSKDHLRSRWHALIWAHVPSSHQLRRARARWSCAFDILERPSIPLSFASS
jgi:hypothetical protein